MATLMSISLAMEIILQKSKDEGRKKRKLLSHRTKSISLSVLTCFLILSDNDFYYSITKYVRFNATTRSSANLFGNMNAKQKHYQRNCLQTIEEGQYLDVVKHFIEHGLRRTDSTGTGTVSVFGAKKGFNLQDAFFPLLNIKRELWRGVL